MIDAWVVRCALTLCLLLVGVIISRDAVALAQTIDHPCADEVAPDDGFVSAGVGLTRPELAARYGEAEIGQGSLIYDYEGVDLHKVDCDLILAFPRDGADREGLDEVALAEGLLPADAELVGAITLGTTIAPNRDQTATLWRSVSLAERFALLDERRGGEILILYTYDSPGMERGPIARIELRTVAAPE